MKTPSSNPDALERLEPSLLALVKARPLQRLPPARQLARELHTSTRLLSLALRRLEKRGLVRIEPRSGVFVLKDGKIGPEVTIPHAPKKRSATQRLADCIADRIARGHYPPGSQLPKVSWLCACEHVGAQTVLKAIGILEDQGMVVRKGRGFMVGLAGGRLPDSDLLENTGHRAGTLLVLQWNEGEWRGLSLSERTRAFPEAFLREASREGLRIQPVLAGTGHKPLGLPSGRDQVEKAILDLGESYRGSLVTIPPTRQMVPLDQDLSEWLARLCGFGRRVVWFDRLNEASGEGRIGPVTRSFRAILGQKTVRRNLVRCHFDERQGVRLALRALAELGHVRIGLPGFFDNGEDWIRSRLRYLREEAQTMRLELVTAQAAQAGIQRRPLAVGAEGAPPVPRPLRAAELLAPFLERRDTTALIAPNDLFAHAFYGVLHQAGLDIPRDYSLISFDAHAVQLYPYSISSIDFGFDSLGYLAFHMLLDTTTIAPDRFRSVAARCAINHRASICPPRTA